MTDQPLPEKQPYPPPQETTTVVVTQQPVVATIFKDYPTKVKCPNCGNDVTSNISYQRGLLTWLAVGILLVFGLWMGCCLIPLCIKELQDVVHTCPVCNYTLGKYERVK